MPKDVSARVDRLEESQRRAWQAIEALADKQGKLDDTLVLLTEAQIRTEQRFQQSDARIEKLVSAIGELLRSGNAPRKGGRT